MASIKGLYRQNSYSAMDNTKLDEIVLNAFLTKTETGSARTSRRVQSPLGDIGLQQYILDCNKYGAIPVNFFMRHVHEDKFIMKYYGLGPLGAKALSRPLELNTSIREVDLEGNSIGPRGALYLASSLRDNVYISHLNLADNNLQRYGTSAIAEMMRENTTIKSLDLSGNELTDYDGRIFFYLLKHNHNLKNLAIRHNKLGEFSTDWLIKAFDINDTLHVLDVSWNHIRKHAAVEFSDMMVDNGCLKELYMCMNGLGFEGAAAMGRVLKENSTLEVLDISANRIPAEGAATIATALEANTTLQKLFVGKNPISADGALMLLNSINTNTSSALTLLNIEGVDVSNNFAKMQRVLFKDRGLVVVRGRVLKKRRKVKPRLPSPKLTDLDTNFQNDPLTKLRKYCSKRKIRLLDLFKQFDKDQSWSVSIDELKTGIRSTGIDMDEKELDALVAGLDKDGDGDIDYKELAIGDKSNMQERLQVAKHNRVQEQMLKDHAKKQKELMDTYMEDNDDDDVEYI